MNVKKKFAMHHDILHSEVVHLLDEFLWEEEILEVEACHSAPPYLSEPDRLTELIIILDSLSGLSGVASSHEHLLRIESILMGSSTVNSSAQSFFERLSSVILQDGVQVKLFKNVLRILDDLLSYISSNPICLNRDTSRLSSVSQRCQSPADADPAIISGAVRLCLNLLYISVLFGCGTSDLHATLQKALLLHADPTIPVRKVVLFIFRLLSVHGKYSDMYLPSNTVMSDISNSPMGALLHSVPFLRLPGLSNFRSFVAVAVHQSELRNWKPEGNISVRKLPAALAEGIEICDTAMMDFIQSYRFHETEVEMIRTNVDLSRAFDLYVKLKSEGKVGKNRRNLLHAQFSSSRFTVNQLAKHVISNYQLIASNDETSGGEESDTASLPHLPMVHEAFRSCHDWLATDDNQEELIEAIADAAVPPPVGVLIASHPQKNNDKKTLDTVEVKFFMKKWCVSADLIIVLLKILLAACRGATDPSLSPTNSASFDLDRDHLLTQLERSAISHRDENGDSFRRRNFEIISNAITGILLLLLKLAAPGEESDSIQSHIVSSNGCLVLLKLITSFPSDNEIFYNLENDSIFPFLAGNKSWALAVPARGPTSVFRSLKALYILCKHSTSRIKKFLVHYKVAVVLKRFFTCPNIGVLQISYKLFKLQMRFLGKKWKLLHVKLLSCCFNATSLDLIDDWLLTDPDQTDTLSPGGLNDSRDGNSLDLKTNSFLAGDEYAAYLEEARKIDFTDLNSIKHFCEKTGENYQDVFGVGIHSYSEWRQYGVGF